MAQTLSAGYEDESFGDMAEMKSGVANLAMSAPAEAGAENPPP